MIIILKLLVNDVSFVSLISTNPNILNTISVINKFGYDLEDAAKVLNISPNELINKTKFLSSGDNNSKAIKNFVLSILFTVKNLFNLLDISLSVIP